MEPASNKTNATILMSQVSALVRLLAFILMTLVVIPPYALCLLVRWRYRPFAQFYWRLVGHILHLDLVVHGKLAGDRPLLCVANHTSYVDIVVLGALIPGAFVAKSEVAGWPGFGLIAKLGRTIFVDRRPTQAAKQRDEIAHRLTEGEPLILFPEGTSNDGNRVLPFKSALFTVAEFKQSDVVATPLTVQPISVAYTRVDGLPLGQLWRHLLAWYGDMELAPHLWRALGLGRKRVEVVFHAPVTVTQFANRKQMAAACQAVVAEGVADSLAGRLDTPVGSKIPRLGTSPPGMPGLSGGPA